MTSFKQRTIPLKLRLFTSISPPTKQTQAFFFIHRLLNREILLSLFIPFEFGIAATLNLVYNKVNLEINPTLNLVWNKLDIDITNNISNIQNNFNVNINNSLTAIQNKLNVEITGYLVGIQNNLDVNITPTLNLVYNKLNVDISNSLTAIQNNLNVAITGYLVDIENKLDVEITGYLVGIQNNLDVNITPTLNLVYNKLNVDISNSLTAIQNNLNVAITGYLVDIENKLNVEITGYLVGIEDKLTPEVFVRTGECIEPSEEGDWYQYNELPSTQGKGLQEILTYLTYQIQDLHKDACKGVQPKVAPKELPKLIECVENPETGKMEVKELSLQTMQANFGFVAPWLIGATKKYLVPFVTDKAIDWGLKLLTEQTKKTYELTCKTVEDNSCSVLLPDPSAVWNTEGYYIFFHWILERPKDNNGKERPDLMTKKEREWRQPTQLAEPIAEILSPDDPEAVWDAYFAGIYQILGNMWGQLRAKNKVKRLPLYKGWFESKDEGRRFFNSIKTLTKVEVENKNNPAFPDKDNPSTRLVNQGKKIVLRKVCVGRKFADSDDVEILIGYEPKKK